MPLLPSPAIPVEQSPQLKLALKYAEALGAISLSALAETITDDYIHHICPESLGVPTLKGKDAFLEFFGQILPQFVLYDLLIKEIIEAPGKVICHVDVEGKTKTGLDYKNEYIVILSVKEQADGSFKGYEMKEISDSKVSSSFMAALLGGAPPA